MERVSTIFAAILGDKKDNFGRLLIRFLFLLEYFCHTLEVVGPHMIKIL
jgi:hypothetical protein